MGKKLAVVTVVGLLALFGLSRNPSADELQANIAFSDFLFHVDNGQVRDVTIQGNRITGHFSDARSFRTYAPDDPNLIDRLIERGVRITAAPADDGIMLLIAALQEPDSRGSPSASTLSSVASEPRSSGSAHRESRFICHNISYRTLSC